MRGEPARHGRHRAHRARRIEIHPGTPKPTEIATHGDHRIVMSFAVAGLRTPGLTYDDPGCVRKTFPRFHEVFADFAYGLAAR